ncbi:MAG TPA: cation:proton antiporter [Tepidisphaeraceae bacterium]|nr:cation:proton antiporter [Tepidisphaeraceae bacterium]
MLLAQVHVEAKLVVVLLQLSVIIVAARLFAALFRKIGQPAVVGEIAAGLILGPSVLGSPHFTWVHEYWSKLFHPTDPGLQSLGDVFTMLSQLGLIFLLFLIGLEFDFKHLKTSRGSSLFISIMGIIGPFGLGYGLAYLMFPHLGLEQKRFVGFALFMGTAMSITAIPILGRIMMELGITRSRIGAVTITAAAIDDACGWILLATVSALVRSNFRIIDTLVMLAETLAFAAVMILVVRPLLVRWFAKALAKSEGFLTINSLAFLIIVMFLCAIATSIIGIFAIFGAFILGATMSDQEQFRNAVAQRLRDFVTAFFLPIFFTYTGLRTDIGSVGGGTMWLFAFGVTAAAIIGKWGGCTLAARLSGFSNRESCCIGVMMNTRALMELIVINVGFELGVIPPSVFCMLVIMALVTTVMTAPLLLRLKQGTELEAYIDRSGFIASPAMA